MGVDVNTAIEQAEKGIQHYLDVALKEGKVDQQSYDAARQNAAANIRGWLSDPNIDDISPNLKSGILQAVDRQRWEDIVNAFRKRMSFGTGGIRGMMAGNKEAILRLKAEGLDAPILKGPNTLNNVVLLLTSAGVAKFGRDKGFDKIVIGYDSRIRGFDFAQTVAELFLGYGFSVFFFDEPCPYPEVTFAIPYKEIRADIGILISASHNDYRYNGYKLSCSNGSQFDPEQRAEMYDRYIVSATTDDIKLVSFEDAAEGKVVFLGGERLQDEFQESKHKDSLINLHEAHREHVTAFLLQETEKTLSIAYCAFHGAGRVAVPRLLRDIGFANVKPITHNGLNDLDGLFPSFCSDPGKERQPDPGDPRAAETAVEAFEKEFPGQWQQTNILVGTDPDADRCGLVVKVPQDQQFLYGNRDHVLLPADDVWALLMWYRLKFDPAIDPAKTFVVLSHTTSDSIVKLAVSNGLGAIKTWVGFAALSAAVRDTWNGELAEGLYEGRKNPDDPLCDPFIQEAIDCRGRSYNLGAMEQSNGFSILGFPPKDQSSLGEKGHVRDKDGTFAAVLVAEIADWARASGTTLFELIDKHIYLDPNIGLFVNHYEPDPMDGEYPGIEGDRIKKSILTRTLQLHQSALAGGLAIAELPVASAVIYRTGKYDRVYPPTADFQFPDEGVRFYFDTERLNYLTIRPSGTGNALRFHIQLHSPVDQRNLIDKKKELRQKAVEVADHIRELVGAPRGDESST